MRRGRSIALNFFGEYTDHSGMSPPPSATYPASAARPTPPPAPVHSATFASSRSNVLKDTNRIAIETAPSRAVCLLAGAVGFTMIFLGFVGGLAIDGVLAIAIGRGIGTPILPVVIAAVIGWGNERRARIAFIALGAIFIPLLLLQVLGALAV